MEINNEYIKGELKQVRPNIFAIAIKDNYQRCMLFCRYIELHDSPYEEIRNKFFTLEKYMEVYRNEFKKSVFTYPEDWEGFGISSDMLERSIKTFSKDKGPYDEIMAEIYYYCERTAPTPKIKWYLIGTDSLTSDTMGHEICHGMYDTNLEYRKNCDRLISNMKKEDYETFRKKIVDMGYPDEKQVIDDEIQAWMSTGLSSGLDTKELKKYQQEFINNFKRFEKSLIAEGNILLKSLLSNL